MLQLIVLGFGGTVLEKELLCFITLKLYCLMNTSLLTTANLSLSFSLFLFLSFFKTLTLKLSGNPKKGHQSTELSKYLTFTPKPSLIRKNIYLSLKVSVFLCERERDKGRQREGEK